MSYQMMPVFKCAICCHEDISAAWQPIPFGFRLLPEGWVGSEWRYGDCYCEQCATAMRKLRSENTSNWEVDK